MSTIAIKNFCAQNCSFKDESALPMALSLIPVVGDIIHLVKDFSINKRLIGSDNINDKINLLNTKDKYRYIGFGRELLMVALLVTEIALGIMNPILGMLFLFIFSYAAATHLQKVLHNAVVIKQLQSGINVNFTA